MAHEHHIQSPYKGLAPYDIGDKDNFFGRERETEILLGKMFAKNVTLLYAGTGVGKTSLLRAKIIPELTERHALDVVYYADWVSEPLEGLKTAIRKALIANGKITERELKMSDDLAPFLDACAAYSSEPLLLILDQFEELFQYHSRSSGRLLPFVEQMARVINAPRLPVSVTFAMREDFLAELDAFKGHVIGSLYDNRYRLEQLSIEQAREAIEKPVARLGFRYQEGLVDLLLRDLAAREQAKQADVIAANREAEQVVEPPYLQIVCNELWRAERESPQRVITLDRYAALGGTQEMILKHFKQVMSRFSLREQSLAFEMFRYLVTERGTKMAYRADDLASSQLLGVPAEELQPILAHLASKEARVLRADQRLDQTWYELYHDVFARIIRVWSEEFQTDDNRRIYRHLTNAARKWMNAGRDESLLLRGAALLEMKEWQKRNRADTLAPEEERFWRESWTKHANALWLKRGIVAAIGLFAIISTFAGFYANTQRKEAVQQSRFALIRTLVAYALQDNIDEDRERAALLAKQAYLLNQQYHGNVQTQIDDALRRIFHTDAIVKEPYSPVLVEQVCQKVKLKTALTKTEWAQLIGNVVPLEPACPELNPTAPLQLRSEPMRANSYMALSLNMADAGGYGKTAHDVPNQFENRGEVIFDRATGLT
ncbi:PBS lyase HEAT-like repeat [Candidatus Moduliflexus flocculans]|uniref:PBS lyase HEAT-like repeat n=1 Tax=Candidatus Moduliflexus flocculans TaxID=1499966 RepID=A0A081BQU2_9BACT|nr:PBS lyase HEAT-like repeat [Candidatus Moduliflexus flocculans]